MKFLVLLLIVVVAVVVFLVVRARRNKPKQVQRAGNYSTQTQVGGTTYQSRKSYDDSDSLYEVPNGTSWNYTKPASKVTNKPVSHPSKHKDDEVAYVSEDFSSAYTEPADFYTTPESPYSQGDYEAPAPSYDPSNSSSYDSGSSSSYDPSPAPSSSDYSSGGSSYDSGSSSSSSDSGSSGSSSDY